ncbi:hypothetical protein ACHAXR_013430 [Thalassiosira sp. AJA248-18]
MEEKPNKVGVGGSKRRCRYGEDCRKANCKFYHPPSTGTSNDAHEKKPNPKNAAPKRDRSKIQCRYGMQCRNTKCPFFHHPAAESPPDSSPTSPTRVSSPHDAVNVNGKGPHISSPICSQIVGDGHNKPSETPHATAEQSPSSTASTFTSNGKANAAPTPSRKATKKKKCRWGAGCRNKKCSFIHPGGPRFDGDAVQSPRNSAMLVTDDGNDPKPASTVLPHKAAPPNHGAKKKVPPRPAVHHPILPPSPMTPQEPSISVKNEAYSPSLLFPPTESLVSSIPIARTQTSEAMSRFNNIFSSVSISNAPPSGFPGDGTRERTPLYSKTSSAFHSLSTGENEAGEQHAQFSQPAREAAVKEHPQDQPPDADWLFEVLGLNDIDVNDMTTSPQRQPVIEDVVEEYTNVNNMGNNNTTASIADTIFKYAPPDEHIRPTPTSDEFHVDVNSPKNEVLEIPTKKLIPEDEIVQSRRAALELRLESQQNANNPESLFTLLQTCRSKQDMIKNALERSMDTSGEAGTDTELDETNVVALLELNELLVGAIDMAESSLHIAKKRNEKSKGDGVQKVTAAKSSRGQRVKQSKEKESSWKPVEKKAAPPAAKTTAKKNKNKPTTENPVKSEKLAIKSSQPSKSVKMPTVEHQGQVEKPAVELTQSKPPTQNSVDSAQQEKEKMARMLEEARNQAAAARERKKSKKNKKFDRWLKQNEEARENRAKSWSERIAKENDYVDLIQKLLVAEFLRQSKNKAMGLTAERVLSDSNAAEIVTKECREAYHVIFGGLKCRVVVAGSENKDMNGRQGTICYWDREKAKFCVGLDTKKGSDLQFLIPEILELLTSSRPSKSDRKSSATSYDINVHDLISYGGVSLGLSFSLLKSHVIALGSAVSTKIGLEAFCNSRNNEERRQKMEEEAEKKREEEDQKRRASRRAEENAAWERRKEQMRRDKEEYEEMKREWTNDRRQNGRSMFDYDDDDDDEECQCPRCRFGDRFSSSGSSWFFNIGGIPFRVRFDNYDSEEDSFFDEFDERWEEQFEEEKEQENIEQAEILGVDPDADARTIKLAYRRLALKYHPDKWKSDSEHGMSSKEAENRFKSIQSAYDHLMSNFDD